MFLIADLGKSVGPVGKLTDNGGCGWSFISYIQRGNGRKLHDCAENAVPKWFTGYIVDQPDMKSALSLTDAYRKGYALALQPALDGCIRVVRQGDVG